MGRAAASLLTAMAIAACSCSGSHPFAAITPSGPGASPSALPSPSAPVTPDLPLTAVAFTCRLPVLITTHYGDGATMQGGFVMFPAATYQEDPYGEIDPQPDGRYVTRSTPLLEASSVSGLPFYDLAMKRWLPVGAGQTSPDGTSYAYIAVTGGTAATQVHVVQVTGSDDHVLSIPPPPTGVGWQLEDFNGKSVYLSVQVPDQSPSGVWRYDLATSSLHQLVPTSAGHVQLVQNGVAWVSFNDPADPSPPIPAKGEAFDSLASINLATGGKTTWMYRPGQSVIFWGLDSSARPVVMVRLSPDSGAVLPLVLLDVAGGNGIAIPAGFLRPVDAMEADTGRLWFGGPAGIYYWTLATGLIKVYAFEGEPGFNQTIAPAGHCV